MHCLRTKQKLTRHAQKLQEHRGRMTRRRGEPSPGIFLDGRPSQSARNYVSGRAWEEHFGANFREQKWSQIPSPKWSRILCVNTFSLLEAPAASQFWARNLRPFWARKLAPKCSSRTLPPKPISGPSVRAVRHKEHPGSCSSLCLSNPPL